MLLKAISGSPSLTLVLDSINFSLTLLMSSYSELRLPSFWCQMSCRLNYCLNPGQLLLLLLFLLFIYLNFVRMKTAFTIISYTSVRYRHMLPAKKIYASCSAWNRLEWPLLLTSHPYILAFLWPRVCIPTQILSNTLLLYWHFPSYSTKCRKLNKQPWVSNDG